MQSSINQSLTSPGGGSPENSPEGGDAASQPPKEENIYQFGDFPKFLVLKSTGDKKLVHQNPFLVQRLITKNIEAKEGEVLIKKIGNDLHLEVQKERHSKIFLATSKLGDMEVEISPHPRKNLARGVYVDRDNYLKDSPIDELEHELKSQGVMKVEHIKTRKNGSLVNTKNFVLTFAKRQLPPNVRIGYIEAKIRPYIDNPMRCANCHLFGHTKKRCKDEHTTCAKCGGKNHEYKDCEKETCCVNCKGGHPSNDRKCPIYKKQQHVMEIMARDNISFWEAREKAEQSGVVSADRPTFAEVVVASETSNEKRLTTIERCLEQLVKQNTKNVNPPAVDSQVKNLKETIDALVKQVEGLIIDVKTLKKENIKIKEENKKLKAKDAETMQKSKDVESMHVDVDHKKRKERSNSRESTTSCSQGADPKSKRDKSEKSGNGSSRVNSRTNTLVKKPAPPTEKTGGKPSPEGPRRGGPPHLPRQVTR